jgi:hypothetical protein
MSRDYAIEEVEPGVLVASGTCVFTQKLYTTARFPKAEYDAWVAGAFIQDAMASVSADDREFLLTGISPAAFDAEYKEG